MIPPDVEPGKDDAGHLPVSRLAWRWSMLWSAARMCWEDREKWRFRKQVLVQRLLCNRAPYTAAAIIVHSDLEEVSASARSSDRKMETSYCVRIYSGLVLQEAAYVTHSMDNRVVQRAKNATSASSRRSITTPCPTRWASGAPAPSCPPMVYGVPQVGATYVVGRGGKV